MARYEHLPIYLAAVESVVYFEGIVRNFSRYNKYTLGSDLRNKSRQIACQIMRVNSLRDKREGLEELVAYIEELKLLIRLCNEIRAFHNPNSYHQSSELIANLSRQAQAWNRSIQTTT
jgi:hypothetical protein